MYLSVRAVHVIPTNLCGNTTSKKNLIVCLYTFFVLNVFIMLADVNGVIIMCNLMKIEAVSVGSLGS